MQILWNLLKDDVKEEKKSSYWISMIFLYNSQKHPKRCRNIPRVERRSARLSKLVSIRTNSMKSM